MRQGKVLAILVVMAKVTSKLQVTIPRRLARECGIEPGDEVEWSATDSGLRITTPQSDLKHDVGARLKWFREAMARQDARQSKRKKRPASKDRGWTREDLYYYRGSR